MPEKKRLGLEDLQAIYDKAFSSPGETFPVGRLVICDICDKDWTESAESGGYLFESKAVCPDCAASFMQKIIQYSEQHFIKGECPPDKSFADWVRAYRGPDAGITVKAWTP
jgi:hypothetical protein